MISFSNYLIEDTVTRREVGGGLGGLIGRGLGVLGGGVSGAFLGNILGGGELGAINPHALTLGSLIGTRLGGFFGGKFGRKVGENSISNPDEEADFSKASHRVGYLASPQTSQIGNIGTLINPNLTRLGTNFHNAFANNEGAARIGYGTTGRLGTLAFGPLSGIFTPKNLRR